MRTLAIDLGTRRIGLALSDEGGRFATPLEVLQVRSPDQATELVAAAAKKHAPAQLLLGLPLNMDGTLGDAAQTTIAWGKSLSARCALPLIFVDERLSSFAAEESLTELKKRGAKLTRKSKKQRQDALAAADFLQSFLDGRLLPFDAP
jgi:putative Holliday junction resolvase